MGLDEEEYRATRLLHSSMLEEPDVRRLDEGH